MDVDGMLDTMTLRQFSEWEAFDRVEPIGSRPLEIVLSVIGAIVAKAMGSKMTPEQFRPWVKSDDETPASAAEIKAAFSSLTRG